jgi:hypothetical protein
MLRPLTAERRAGVAHGSPGPLGTSWTPGVADGVTRIDVARTRRVRAWFARPPSPFCALESRARFGTPYQWTWVIRWHRFRRAA